MLLNYFKTALRYLSKNKAYTFINVFGLSLGLATFIVLSLYVNIEFSHDEHWREKDSLYQVFIKDTLNNGGFTHATQVPMGPLLVESIPEITDFVRFGNMRSKVIKAKGERFLINRIHYTDPSSIEFFDLKSAVEGLAFSLSKSGILLSKLEAERLFGSSEDAIDQEVEIVTLGKFIVEGVFENVQGQTHVKFDYLISFENANDAFFAGSKFRGMLDVNKWGSVSAFPLYVKLNQSEADLSSIEKKIEEALVPHKPNQLVALLPIDEVYFSEYNIGYFKSAGNQQRVEIFMLVALVVLVVAIINYMNLATARYTKRAKEVGLRKTLGGHRSQLTRQFLMESFMITFVSITAAICVMEVALPVISELVGQPLKVDYSSPMTYIFLTSILLFVGTLAGVYPALYLSKTTVIEVLSAQGTMQKEGSSLRKVLVGTQVFVCLSLMTVALIINGQFTYMSTIDLGFDQEQIIGIPLSDQGIKSNSDAFRSELTRSAMVDQFIGASFSLFEGSTQYFVEPEGKEEGLPVTLMMVEPEFTSALSIDLVLGADFNLNSKEASSNQVLINETALETFGWDNPIGKDLMGRKVVGVVKDFIFGSAKEAIEPLMIMTSTDDLSYAYVKFNGGNTQDVISHIETVFNQFATDYPFEYTFLDQAFELKYKEEQRLTKVFSSFTILAIIVAGLGILGLSMFIAESRIKEVGIRKVLGANVVSIVWLLNSGITKLVLLVSLASIPLSYFLMNQWLSDFAFKIDISPIHFIIPAVALLMMIWSILLVQSLKSARTNPIQLLRTE